MPPAPFFVVLLLQSALVLELTRSISSTLDFDQLLREIAERTRELAGAERCSVFVLDEETNTLVSRVQQGTREIRVQMGEGIAGYVAERGEVACALSLGLYFLPELPPFRAC